MINKNAVLWKDDERRRRKVSYVPFLMSNGVAVVLEIELDFVPWLLDEVESRLTRSQRARALLDGVYSSSVCIYSSSVCVCVCVCVCV